MQRVLIVGSPGAGKSTVAKGLARRTGLPLAHLDELYFAPGWVPVTRPLWLERLQTALDGEHWILDGNFSTTLVQRAYRADTVIFLNPPRWRCLWRAFWRERLGRYPHGGHHAKWPSQALLLDIWGFAPQAAWELAQLRTVPGLRLVVLEGDRQVEEFLNSVSCSP
ncbi:DNA topology modulation protein FlaR [Deinococcus sp.]|uniref:DNA topology modulation protein FlaR n=1 Tax=Deinococcus sp. TaxID=47478 RepID=UPI0028699775|nr:DNA topology modulation protein FlaR [Deinococcus sp.]